MKRLILLRHAKAAPLGSGDDLDRPLAPRGRAQMALVARHLAGLPPPDLALVSPAARTRETWSLAGLAKVPVRIDERIYEADRTTLLEVARSPDDPIGTALLVGHNPGLQDLTRRLVAAGDQALLEKMRLGTPTASVAIIECRAGAWAEIEAGTGRLVGFETPASLGLGGDD